MKIITLKDKTLPMKATREAYGETLARLGATHPEVVVLDADLSGSTKTSVFAKKFPERFFNAGIAEQNMIGVAGGIASTGKTVFASSFAMFATGRPYEQIRNTVAYSLFNVKIVASHGGVTVGEDGATHQALEDVALMCGIPDMTVIVPADSIETDRVIEFLMDHKGPAYVRVSRSKTPVFLPEGYQFVLGEAAVLREGADVCLMAVGNMVVEALKAAETLAEEGITARVLNMSSMKPIDENAIVKASREIGCIVTAEEHSVNGGLAARVATVLAHKAPCLLKMVAVQDRFGQSGTPEELLEYYGLTAEVIADKARRIIKEKGE